MYHCVNCPKGFEFVDRTEPCSGCKAGRYQDKSACGYQTLSSCAGPGVQCKECVQGKAAPSASEKCEKCEAGFFQELTSSVEWGGRVSRDVDGGIVTQCKACTAGLYFTSATHACETCTGGKYQDENTRKSAVCKTCTKGTDAPQPSEKCANCPTGRYQPLARSVTYGCTAMSMLEACEPRVGSNGDGKAGDSRVGVKLFNGTCCRGSPLAVDNVLVDQCMKSETGTEQV
jgi:hypothetical protein